MGQWSVITTTGSPAVYENNGTSGAIESLKFII